MPLPLEDHVRAVLLENERSVSFYKAVSEGWSAFEENYPLRHRWIRKSSGRHMVWEEVARRLKAVASNDSGIEVLEHQDTLSLILENEVLIRLKHADASLATQNYPTIEAQAFDDHDVDLFGYSGLQRVRLCYVLNQFESDLVWVGVAAHTKGKFLWKIELDRAGSVAEPARLPLSEEQADTARLARLRHPENGKADDRKNKKNG